MKLQATLAPLCFFTACLDLSLPPQQPLGPGSVLGSVVHADPGQTALRPASGATIELVGSGVRTQATGETAVFNLTPVDTSAGHLLIRFDQDGDGQAEKQKLFKLDTLAAGRGKVVSLGQVVLGRTGAVRGRVLRGDVARASGHGGTSVLIPEGPYFGFSGDDGTFVLENLPEGPLTLGVFRPGYLPVAETVDLRAGELFELRTITLEPDASAASATVKGRVLLPTGVGAPDVTVSLSLGRTATTDADGRYSFRDVPYELYSVGFVKAGFLTAELVNVIVASPSVTLRDVTLAPGDSMNWQRDAGRPAYDAGSTGGGGGAAGGSGGGAAGGSGVDGGLLPVALVDAPTSVSPNTLFTMSGQRSLGDRPLVYTWTQDAGPAITIPNNGTQLAATPMIRSPPGPTLLKFNLTVTEPSGRSSAPAPVLIPVAVPPIAVIDAGFPSLVYASQRVVLNGSGSTDPNGSGIVLYDWQVSPSFVTLTPLDGGLVQLDMPSSVGTSVIITTQLSVVNGLTLRSPTVQAAFQLSNAPAPSWSLDAGPWQTVGSGSTVTLSALASSPVPGANFVYEWSPGSETSSDAGAPDWLLSNPNTATTAFVAPKVEGPTPRSITFTARATETTGVLSPSVRTASIVVAVIDRRRPQIVSTSVVAGEQGFNSGFVLFDEDVDPGSLSAVNVTAAPGSPSTTVVERRAFGPRVFFSLRPPMAVGMMYTLTVASVEDLAPAPQNQMSPVAPISFFPRVRWTPAWESSSSSMAEMWPGIAVRRATPTQPLQVFVFGRKEGTSWFGAPFNAFSCVSPPCSIADDSAAPAEVLAGPFVRSRRGHVVGGMPIAALQTSDFVGDAGVAWRYGPGGWQRLPQHQGALFTAVPSVTLSSVFVDDAGIKIAHLDGGSWIPFSTVSTNTAQFWVGPAADPILNAAAPTGSGYYIAGRASSSGQSFLFQSTNGGSFGVEGPISNVAEVRPVLYAGATGFNIYRQTNGTVYGTCFGSGGCGTNQYFTGVSSFDAVGAPTFYAFLATAMGGQLELHFLPQPQQMPTRMAGPLRSGVPSTMLNNDPSCYADRPELTIAEGILFLAWQERCGAGPWRVYVRALD